MTEVLFDEGVSHLKCKTKKRNFFGLGKSKSSMGKK
jgi:hypothetical protein